MQQRLKNISGADSFFVPNARLAKSAPSLIRQINLTKHDGSLSRIGLGLGELNFPMPHRAQEANAKAVREGKTGYTLNAGLDELRTAVARQFKDKSGVSVGKENVIITSGATGGLYIALEAFLNPGDEVLIPDLSYPLYDSLPRKWGARVKRYALTNAFDIDVNDILGKITEKTKLIVLNSPSNPTGRLVSQGAMEELAAKTKNNKQLFSLSDEIYSTCIYGDAKHHSMAEFTDKMVVIDGLSKRASQTGKRIGWMIAPPSVISVAEKSQQQTYVCAPADSQYAALPVLAGECDDDLAHYHAELSRRREAMGAGLREIPKVKFLEPQGAFYYFVDVSVYGKSLEVAQRLVREQNVVTVPGLAFGKAGDNYLRLSFAGDLDQSMVGLGRIKQAFAQW